MMRFKSSFLKKVFVFQKIHFKITVLKTFKISTDCVIKPCGSPKQRAILKISRTTYAFSVGFKMKLLKEFSSVKTKANLNFWRKFAERSNH